MDNGTNGMDNNFNVRLSSPLTLDTTGFKGFLLYMKAGSFVLLL